MKLQQTPNFGLEQQPILKKSENENKSKSPSFGSGATLTTFANFLQTNQAMGATAVDVTCMGLPRTAVDFTRGPSAGIETARREFTSTFNDALLGVYGTSAAWLLAKGINKNYATEVHSITADSDTLDVLANIRSTSGDIRNEENLTKYLNNVFDNTKAFNPNSGAAKEGWVSLSDKAKSEISQIVKEQLKSDKKDDKEFKQIAAKIKTILTSDTGVDSKYKLSTKVGDKGAEKAAEAGIDDYVQNILKVSKTFMSEKVSNSFASGNASENIFIKAIKSLNTKTTIAGMGLCILIGALAQPVNMYLTKKKTGQSGFVGGGEENKSTGFKILKSGLAGLALFGALSTITKGKDGEKLIEKYKRIPEALKFKGLFPTIEQFKLVYGTTIFSRLLSARNENELREGSIKDSLGFVNWLILGGFVQKLTAMGFEAMSKVSGKEARTYLKKPVGEEGRTALKRFFGSEVISRSEVLHEAMNKLGQSTIKDGKALSFRQMYKTVDEAIKSGKLDKAFKGRLRALNVIQLAGYLYSGLVLGLAIPKLNIAITHHFQKKEKEQKAAQANQTAKAA